MFLGSCLVLFVSLRAYGYLDDKLCESSMMFSMLEVLPVLSEEGFSPFSFGPFLICLLLVFLSRLC